MFLLEQSIKLLWKVLEEGKANKEHLNNQQHEFLKVASKAVRRTLSYIRENKRNIKTEEELSELWANVAVAVQPFDSDLAGRCYIKGNYWANPDKWSGNEVEKAGIEIERIEAEIGSHFKGRKRVKKSKQQKTIEKPANLPNEEISNPKENNQEFVHDTIKTSKPWYKRIWAIVVGLIIFLAALTTLILNLDKIKEIIPQNDVNKTTTDTKTDKKDENKFALSLKNICQDIESRPLVQQQETAMHYIGVQLKEQELELFEIYLEDNKFGLNMIIPGQPDVTFLKGIRIYFSVDRHQYPELHAAKKGLKFYVTGKIEEADKFMIKLSDVSLKFD